MNESKNQNISFLLTQVADRQGRPVRNRDNEEADRRRVGRKEFRAQQFPNQSSPVGCPAPGGESFLSLLMLSIRVIVNDLTLVVEAGKRWWKLKVKKRIQTEVLIVYQRSRILW